MIILKSERDLEAMRPACAVAASVLNDIASFIQPGMTTSDVNEFAASQIKHYGARSAFLGYRKYPCQICISVNEQVVHGLAGTGHCGSVTSSVWMSVSFITASSATRPRR